MKIVLNKTTNETHTIADMEYGELAEILATESLKAYQGMICVCVCLCDGTKGLQILGDHSSWMSLREGHMKEFKIRKLIPGETITIKE